MAVVDGVDDPADRTTPLTMWMVCGDWILYTDIRSLSYTNSKKKGMMMHIR